MVFLRFHFSFLFNLFYNKPPPLSCSDHFPPFSPCSFHRVEFLSRIWAWNRDHSPSPPSTPPSRSVLTEDQGGRSYCNSYRRPWSIASIASFFSFIRCPRSERQTVSIYRALLLNLTRRICFETRGFNIGSLIFSLLLLNIFAGRL